MTRAEPPKWGRIVAAIMAVAFILYLDRVCLAEVVKSASFLSETRLTSMEVGRLLSAFFLAYAAFQLPAGWLSDRFGPRRALTVYIIAWSAATAATGLASGFAALLAARFFCGAAEAGAYPTCGALLRRWTPSASRAKVSSLVTASGRIGGALAPFLTAWLVLALGWWRRALWVDGAAGILIAGVYWMQAPKSGAERDPGPSFGLWRALRLCCSSGNLWLLSLWWWLINVGWAFLITWLPTYLKQQRHVDDLEGGRMVTAVLACGLVGQLVGGWWADLACRKFGLRNGRRVAFALTGLIGGTAYFACQAAATTAAVLLCCGLVSFAVDLSNPASWAFVQDIGGHATASAFGWANMWGNLGAATIAYAVPHLGGSGGLPVFVACGTALFASTLVALALDATKPLAAASA